MTTEKKNLTIGSFIRFKYSPQREIGIITNDQNGTGCCCVYWIVKGAAWWPNNSTYFEEDIEGLEE